MWTLCFLERLSNEPITYLFLKWLRGQSDHTLTVVASAGFFENNSSIKTIIGVFSCFKWSLMMTWHWAFSLNHNTGKQSNLVLFPMCGLYLILSCASIILSKIYLYHNGVWIFHEIFLIAFCQFSFHKWMDE